MSFPKRIAFALCTTAVLAAPVAASASNYPERPVSVIIPGNSADLVGRTMADELSKRLGKQFIVENRGGAGGVIGTDHVVRSAPDGYTITSLSPISVKPAVEKLSYDPFTQLAPISLLAQGRW